MPLRGLWNAQTASSRDDLGRHHVTTSTHCNNFGLNYSSASVGKVVELRDGDFLQIHEKAVINGHQMLRGLRFQRASLHQIPVARAPSNEITLLLPKQLNEGLLNIRQPSRESLEQVPFSEAICFKQILITSDPYPEHSNHNDDILSRDRCNTRPLVCRWVFSGNWKDGMLRTVRPSEAGRTIGLHTKPAQDMSEFKDLLYAKILSGEVSYASCFSGGGGDLLGAKLAGLDPIFGFDKDAIACSTTRANFPNCMILEVDQYYIITTDIPGVPGPGMTTILHISFPCQPWSRRTIRRTLTHDELEALIYTVGEYLQKFKPLILTMEQVDGLPTRHPNEFKRMLGLIAEQGYNIRWKIFQLRDFGLPSSRFRLIIFASQQGVPLPTFPEPEYGPGRLYPHVTISDTIDSIPPNSPNHLDTVAWHRAPRPRYDPRTKKLGCITCSGPPESHYDGLRSFSILETQFLQGFPESYILEGGLPDNRRQIGNSVPPLVWALFMKHILRTLEDWVTRKLDDDGLPTTPNNSPVNSGTMSNPIVIDAEQTGSEVNPFIVD